MGLLGLDRTKIPSLLEEQGKRQDRFPSSFVPGSGGGGGGGGEIRTPRRERARLALRISREPTCTHRGAREAAVTLPGKV